MGLPVPSALAQLALTPAYPGHEGYEIRVSTIIDGKSYHVRMEAHHKDTEELMQQRLAHMLNQLWRTAAAIAEGAPDDRT